MRSRHRPEYFPSSFYAFCCCRWSQYNCRWLHIDSIRPQLLYSTQTVVVEADGSSVMGRGWKMPPLLSLRVQSNIDLAQAFECKLQFSFIVCDFAVCITCYTANVSFNALLGTVKISMTALIVNIFFAFDYFIFCFTQWLNCSATWRSLFLILGYSVRCSLVFTYFRADLYQMKNR